LLSDYFGLSWNIVYISQSIVKHNAICNSYFNIIIAASLFAQDLSCCRIELYLHWHVEYMQWLTIANVIIRCSLLVVDDLSFHCRSPTLGDQSHRAHGCERTFARATRL